MNEWIRYPILAYAAVFGTLGGDSVAMADTSVASTAATVALVPTSRPVTSTCPPDVCGRNSAEVEAYPLEELDLDGEKPSRGGFKIVGATVAGGRHFAIPAAKLKLDMVGGELALFDGSGSKARVEGLVVKHGGATYWLDFVEVRYVRSWARRPGCDHADPGTHRKSECYEAAYVIEYQKLVDGHAIPAKGQGEKNRPTLCQEVPSWGVEAASFNPPDKVKGPFGNRQTERWTSPTASAVLVEGEVYDYHSASIVKPTPPGRWFNIACAGSAIGKMKLMGYDPATHVPGWKTERWQRQATLKMITASYCKEANELRFTKTGQKLAFQNRAEWFDPWSSVVTEDDQIEAFWGEDGATCLTLPRSEKWQSDMAWIRKKCGLSKCSRIFSATERKGPGESTASWAARSFRARGGALSTNEEWATFNR
ncbi:MAG: ADYC domain-containing protein [Myxococcota bacterium]